MKHYLQNYNELDNSSEGNLWFCKKSVWSLVVTRMVFVILKARAWMLALPVTNSETLSFFIHKPEIIIPPRTVTRIKWKPGTGSNSNIQAYEYIIYQLTRILFSNKKERTDTCNKDESLMHHAEQKKPNNKVCEIHLNEILEKTILICRERKRIRNCWELLRERDWLAKEHKGT